jgi:hypothetical protein
VVGPAFRRRAGALAGLLVLGASCLIAAAVPAIASAKPAAAPAWSPDLPAQPTTVPADGEENVEGVSCPAAGSCVAVGQYETPAGFFEPLVLEFVDGT